MVIRCIACGSHYRTADRELPERFLLGKKKKNKFNQKERILSKM